MLTLACRSIRARSRLRDRLLMTLRAPMNEPIMTELSRILTLG